MALEHSELGVPSASQNTKGIGVQTSVDTNNCDVMSRENDEETHRDLVG